MLMLHHIRCVQNIKIHLRKYTSKILLKAEDVLTFATYVLENSCNVGIGYFRIGN